MIEKTFRIVGSWKIGYMTGGNRGENWVVGRNYGLREERYRHMIAKTFRIVGSWKTGYMAGGSRGENWVVGRDYGLREESGESNKKLNKGFGYFG